MKVVYELTLGWENPYCGPRLMSSVQQRKPLQSSAGLDITAGLVNDSPRGMN